MKIQFPEIVREIDLAEYAPEVKGTMKVWVNPPIKLLTDYSDTLNKYIDSKGKDGLDGLLGVISKLLSKAGTEQDQWSVDELRELVEGTRDTDPAFFSWLLGRIMKAISDHRAGQKKASAPQPQSSQVAAEQTTNT